MVIAGGLCLIIYSYYYFLYAPLTNKVQQKSMHLIEQTETLDWMKKIKQQGHSSTTKQTVSNSQLLTLLATQLKENETLNFPFQLQQTGSGEIQLTFDEVPFKSFIAWLSKINEKYTITIKQFDIEHTKRPGVTRLMIIINAG